MKTIVYPVFLSLLCLSCVNTHKLIQEGEYQTAFEISLAKLERNKVKTTDIDAFSIAFSQLQQEDKSRIAYLKASGRTDIWPSVYEEALQLKERQRKVEWALNKLRRNGINPGVEFYPVDELILEAREKSAIYFYAKAQQYMVPARNGDRQAARKAYYALKRCMEFISDYRDAAELSREMRDLGITHVLLQTHLHGADERLDARLFATLLGGKAFPVQHDWQMVHLKTDEEQEFHYRMDWFLDNYRVSGDELSYSTCTNTIEVKVDEEIKKVWSEKDSAYIEVVEEIFEEVTGYVTTYTQSKAGSLDLIVEISSLEEEGASKQEILHGTTSWSNEYSESGGDSRAAEDCSSVIGFCEVYPSYYDMLRSAVLSLRSPVFRMLKRPLD